MKLQRYGIYFHNEGLPSDKRFGLAEPDPVLRKIDYAVTHGVCFAEDVAVIEEENAKLRKENEELRKDKERILKDHAEMSVNAALIVACDDALESLEPGNEEVQP
jgi:hypothetical protein